MLTENQERQFIWKSKTDICSRHLDDTYKHLNYEVERDIRMRRLWTDKIKQKNTYFMRTLIPSRWWELCPCTASPPFPTVGKESLAFISHMRWKKEEFWMFSPVVDMDKSINVRRRWKWMNFEGGDERMK